MLNKIDNITGPTLTPKAVYGIRIDIPNSVQFFSSDKCAYIAGNYVVICSVKDKSQFFIQANPEYGQITSFGIDEFGDTIMLAIAQRSQELKPYIIIRMFSKNSVHTQQLDYTKSYKFTLTDLDPYDYYMSISVNTAKGIVATLIGPKTPSAVVIYQYELRSNNIKMIPVYFCSYLTAYKQILINPFNPNVFSLCGEGGFAVLHINEQDKKLVAKLEVDPKTNQFQEFSAFIFNIVSMTWITKSRIAFLNSICDVFLIDSSKKLDNPLKKVIKCINIFDTQSKGKGIFSKSGNLFVCKDDGMIVKLEDKQQIDKNEKILTYERVNYTKYVANLPKMEVHTVSVYTNNFHNFNLILMSTTNSQLYQIDLSNDNNLSDGNNYKYFIYPFHTQEITCLDVCKMKQLVATGSRDRTIKIWNYINLQLEITSEIFEEYPFSISFHPNGLHMAILFQDKFKMIHLLEKSLVVYREFKVFEPNEVKISNFGHFFAISSKNNFSIFNFYTCESVITSKIICRGTLQGHIDDITSFTWDQDDTGFATCSRDGQAFYWQLYTDKEPHLIQFVNKEFKFKGVDIYTMDDLTTIKLLLIDDSNLIEVSQQVKDESAHMDEGSIVNSQLAIASINPKKRVSVISKGAPGSSTTNSNNMNSNVTITLLTAHKPKILLSNFKFSQFFYDKETKILIAGSTNEHTPCVGITKYPNDDEKMKFRLFQANSTGVRIIKPSFDMTHLFTTGSDKCLFFFNILHIAKNDKRDETLEPSDLILIKKEEIDKDVMELRSKINNFDNEIAKEKERFDIESEEIIKEINKLNKIESVKQEKFIREKQDFATKIEEKVQLYEYELNSMIVEHNRKMTELREENQKIIEIKVNEKLNEEKKLNDEKLKKQSNLKRIKIDSQEEISKIIENYTELIDKLNTDLKVLEEQNIDLVVKFNSEKIGKIDSNDIQISFKRSDLQALMKTYEKVKNEHQKLEEKLKNEIREIRKTILTTDTRKNEDKNKLIILQSENLKLLKLIADLQNDKREKEETINEKNGIKRELEKENQELEKFKFVLNYKIKELKHEKDPEEKKMQLLQKQKKDMEEEIKKFQFEQDKNIRELAKNHDTMKVKENDITKIEKNIEKFKNYTKLFQESLYEAMKKSKTHKDLKKELINLKSQFIDKEFIIKVEKPNDSNYDLQRQFLEENHTNFGKKILDKQKLFIQDHQKIMNENKKLLTIINEMEKEKKEIQFNTDMFNNLNKTVAILGTYKTLKSELPIFKKDEDSFGEIRVKRLKKELLSIEKERQFIIEKKKKEKLKMEKEKIKNEKMMNRLQYTNDY